MGTKSEEQTVARVEEEFAAQYAALKKKHPRAVLAVLRDGDKGYDPGQPDKAYTGWKDAYFSSHGPDGMFRTRAENRGRDETQEIFMRHRSPLMRVDLSSIPTGSQILAVRLIVVRAREDRDPRKAPTMWVVEPCNRPWVEHEVRLSSTPRISSGKKSAVLTGATPPISCRCFWRMVLAEAR
jgi:hypothetical protein